MNIVINLFVDSFLDEVCSSGEASQEFLELFQKLMEDKNGRWKLYLSQRGILVQIGTLVGKVHITCAVNI